MSKKKTAVVSEVEWNDALRPLFKRYKGRKHPLAFENDYQLMVMIVLSARASDAMVNTLAPALFKKYPTFKHLAKAEPEELYPLLKVPGFRNKSQWIIGMARTITALGAIPRSMEELTSMKGFGRKSANVFMSQIGLKAEGVIVDLHTLRVAPRLGIAEGDDPKKLELQLMGKVDRKNWHLLGMSLTYLGRETCRPTDPKCHECLLSAICHYNNSRQ